MVTNGVITMIIDNDETMMENVYSNLVDEPVIVDIVDDKYHVYGSKRAITLIEFFENVIPHKTFFNSNPLKLCISFIKACYYLYIVRKSNETSRNYYIIIDK